MNVSELYALTLWVEREIGGKRLLKLYGALWASPDIPDTFDRCEDAIGGVRWNARNMQRSLSVRQ